MTEKTRISSFLKPRPLDKLKKLKQWVCHKDKKPMNPNAIGEFAKSNDPSTWSDYITAVTAQLSNPNRFDGIGFQFGIYEPGLRVAGIDLDHVVQEDGRLSPWAEEIVKTMNSYTEYSPSGTGLHILCFADLPAIGNKKALYNGQGLEMYNHSRYFTVTCKVFGEAKPVADRTEEFRRIHEKYFSKPKTEPKPTTNQPQPSSVQKQSTVTNLTDTELLNKMFASRNGSDIQALWNGDISRYNNDDSRADLALFQHLLFWTGGDVLRADNLFRQSRLMREKWNRDEYRDRTIEAAMNSQRGVYDSKYGLQSPNPSQATVLDKDASKSSESLPEQSNVEEILPEVPLQTYLQDDCEKDYDRFMQSQDRITGFSNLDDKIESLYPGLYVLGAISSLGKTTFACQLADQLSENGEHVLYFSLEQSRYELVAKGLARLSAKSNYKHPYSGSITPTSIPGAKTAMEIRKSMKDPLVKQYREEYARIAPNEVIYECGFDTTITTITATVKHYMETHKVKPVVIIDYLQVVRPSDNRLNTKDTVDNNIRALKMLSVHNDLVVLVISSLNRQNYLTPVDFESFKESGGIEFTADVIWGLQLSVMNDESIFGKDSGIKKKRDAVREAKKALPRKVDLVCLKNRFGISSYTCKFDYYAQYDYFVPLENDSSSGYSGLSSGIPPKVTSISELRKR